MNDTSGRSLPGSSASAFLQRSLANRLRQKLAASGSPEYVLTWKEWDMPGREPICALRARAPRISDNGYGGWPTPCQQDGPNGGPSQGTDRLPGCAALAGWATPTVPRKNDSDYSAFRWNPNKKQDDPVMQILGRDMHLSDVPTEKRGALNPAHPRWLMGYPAEWGFSGATAMQSSRKSRRRSSKRISKQKET